MGEPERSRRADHEDEGRSHGDADVIAEVKRLKTAQEKSIVVFGGARLAQTLARGSLVDEYRLKLEPAVLGSGHPLFIDGEPTRKLKLCRSKAYPSGTVALYYQPVVS